STESPAPLIAVTYADSRINRAARSIASISLASSSIAPSPCTDRCLRILTEAREEGTRAPIIPDRARSGPHCRGWKPGGIIRLTIRTRGEGDGRCHHPGEGIDLRGAARVGAGRPRGLCAHPLLPRRRGHLPPRRPRRRILY